MERGYEGWGERWRMKAEGPRDGGGGGQMCGLGWVRGDGEKNWVGRGLGDGGGGAGGESQ